MNCDTRSPTGLQDSIQTPYRYIVIGGGTAGCPLAASLAKKGKTLLLERGTLKVDDSRFPRSLDKAVQWTRTQSGSWAACANVLGGGSSINAGIFMKETQDSVFFKEHPFLEWEKVQRAFAEITNKVAHERGSPNRFQSCMTEAMKNAGLGQNGVKTDTAHIGIYHPHSLFNAQEERHSATSLLPTNEDASFQNLTIKTNILVTRIIFDTQASQPRAIGVEFQDLDQDQATLQQLMEPQAEFYLSGGALNSPKLLMLSGIGDAKVLKKHNIELILDNPHVGRHLKDKPAIAFSVISHLPIDHTMAQTMAMTEDFLIGTLSGGCIASQMAPFTLGMLPTKYRSPTKRRVMKKFLGLLPAPLLKRVNQQFTIFLVLSNPISEGSVELSSADPQAELTIFSPGLNDPEEIAAMTKGLISVRKVITARSLQSYRQELAGPWSQMVMRRIGSLCSRWYQDDDKPIEKTTPITFPMFPGGDSLTTENQCASLSEEKKFLVGEEVQRWLKKMYVEGWTYTSTCRFGDVVNPDFTVKGISGLSIVDTSVLSRPPRVNAQSTAMMLGLYAGQQAPA